MLAEMAETMLKKLGYEVEIRTNSLEALEVFQANPDGFDLVVTDQTMPQMTGKSLVRKLLNLRPDLPIVLCTGFSPDIDRKKAKTLGIREFIMKALLIRELGEAVRRALEKKPEMIQRKNGVDDGT